MPSIASFVHGRTAVRLVPLALIVLFLLCSAPRLRGASGDLVAAPAPPALPACAAVLTAPVPADS